MLCQHDRGDPQQRDHRLADTQSLPVGRGGPEASGGGAGGLGDLGAPTHPFERGLELLVGRLAPAGLHRLLDRTYTALATGGELPVAADDMRAVASLVDQLLDDRVNL